MQVAVTQCLSVSHLHSQLQSQLQKRAAKSQHSNTFRDNYSPDWRSQSLKHRRSSEQEASRRKQEFFGHSQVEKREYQHALVAAGQPKQQVGLSTTDANAIQLAPLSPKRTLEGRENAARARGRRLSSSVAGPRIYKVAGDSLRPLTVSGPSRIFGCISVFGRARLILENAGELSGARV